MILFSCRYLVRWCYFSFTFMWPLPLLSASGRYWITCPTYFCFRKQKDARSREIVR